MRFGVDLDGTVFEMGGLDLYSPYVVGVPFPGCREVLQAMIDAGHTIYIYTCRTNAEFEGNHPHTVAKLRKLVIQHLEDQKIPYTKVSIYKPICDYYLDDRNLVYSTWLDFGNTLRRLGLI